MGLLCKSDPVWMYPPMARTWKDVWSKVRYVLKRPPTKNDCANAFCSISTSLLAWALQERTCTQKNAWILSLCLCILLLLLWWGKGGYKAEAGRKQGCANACCICMIARALPKTSTQKTYNMFSVPVRSVLSCFGGELHFVSCDNVFLHG